MENSRDRVVWDHPAAAAYTAAADEAAALLGTAKDHAATVAGLDLSGLGLLGTEFAAAWTQAWTDHSGHLDTAAQVTGGYSQAITGWGRTLDAVDTESARDIAGTIAGTGEIQV
ncbi:hypothetical protein ACFXHA_43370 [Nocardia sp. NPDC059240]|uniref:hypothetical protein n=1 Tax=Nocardia sp. NPDC059240 TaxID=3346786 RepID=UPI00369C742E